MASSFKEVLKSFKTHERIEIGSDYNQNAINTTVSYYPQYIQLANLVNQYYYSMTNRDNYEVYFAYVKSMNYNEIPKKNVSKQLEKIQAKYKCSKNVALQYLSLLKD